MHARKIAVMLAALATIVAIFAWSSIPPTLKQHTSSIVGKDDDAVASPQVPINTPNIAPSQPAGLVDVALLSASQPASSAAGCDTWTTAPQLKLLSRQVAAETYCESPRCLSWTSFPSDPDEDAACTFLCRQQSESRPAIHIRSALRDYAITDGSSLRPFTFVAPQRCMDNAAATTSSHREPVRSSLLFVGHSHTRFLVSMLCMMLNASSCAQLDDQFRNISVVYDDELPLLRDDDKTTATLLANGDRRPRLIYVQANYNFKFKLGMLRAHLSESQRKSITHVVVSRGSWDLLFWDRRPTEIALDFAESLKAVFDWLPDAAKILHMPHFTHPKMPSGKLKRQKDGSPPHAVVRASWRQRCFSESRLLRMRDINECAFASVMASSNATPGPFRYYDTYAETKTSLGFKYVDELGHHYQDVFLEHLAMKFLREHVCQAQSSSDHAGELHHYESCGAAACARTAALSGAAFKVIPECSCHSPTERRDHICKKFGRSVPDAARRS